MKNVTKKKLSSIHQWISDKYPELKEKNFLEVVGKKEIRQYNVNYSNVIIPDQIIMYRSNITKSSITTAGAMNVGGREISFTDNVITAKKYVVCNTDEYDNATKEFISYDEALDYYKTLIQETNSRWNGRIYLTEVIEQMPFPRYA